MDNKNVIIIILAIVLVVIAVGCLYFVSMPTAGDNNHVNETNITNNVTNVSQEDNQISTSSDNSGKSYGSQKEYDDWQEDYETGENIHLIESDLDMTLRDDLNRMKKTRSYKGRKNRLINR